jgi:hypothetical protein
MHPGSQAVVQRAGRGEDEARDAAIPAILGKGLGRQCIHLPVCLGVELSGWVVTQAGEMDDTVDFVQRRRRDISNVGDHEFDPVAKRSQRLLAKVEPVEDPDSVAALEKASNQYAPDVSSAPGHEQALPWVGGARRKTIGS